MHIVTIRLYARHYRGYQHEKKRIKGFQQAYDGDWQKAWMNFSTFISINSEAFWQVALPHDFSEIQTT